MVRKIKVTPHEVEVRFDRDAMAAASANGVYLGDVNTILLSPGCDPLVERETMLHEALHAIWNQTLLDKLYPDEEPDSPGEAIISTLAPRLLAVLRDNPQLVAYLTEKRP